jgi:hypothetical protein
MIGTTCNKSVELNNLVASCQQARNKRKLRDFYVCTTHKLLQSANKLSNLFTTCFRTACSQLLEQAVNNL